MWSYLSFRLREPLLYGPGSGLNPVLVAGGYIPSPVGDCLPVPGSSLNPVLVAGGYIPSPVVDCLPVPGSSLNLVLVAGGCIPSPVGDCLPVPGSSLNLVQISTYSRCNRSLYMLYKRKKEVYTKV